MALIQCKECKAQVSASAKACPQCGANVPKKTSIISWIVLFAIVGLVFSMLNQVDTMKSSAAARQELKAKAWAYQSQNDPMTSKPTHTADLRSSNSLTLEAPYSGSNFGNLQIRKKSGKAEEVLFSIEKGQTLCKSYAADCKVMVRFDDAKPVAFSGQNPSDGSSNYVFLSPASRLITEARTAKRIKVSLDIYHNGTQIVEFSSAPPLAWP